MFSFLLIYFSQPKLFHKDSPLFVNWKDVAAIPKLLVSGPIISHLFSCFTSVILTCHEPAKESPQKLIIQFPSNPKLHTSAQKVPGFIFWPHLEEFILLLYSGESIHECLRSEEEHDTGIVGGPEVSKFAGSTEPGTQGTFHDDVCWCLQCSYSTFSEAGGW